MIFAIPTDTCYWIGCDIHDAVGYRDLYLMKWRDFDKPCAIVIRDFEDLKKYSSLNDEQINELKIYPHPFTILLTTNDTFKYPDFIDPEKYKKMAFRIAKQCIPEEVLDQISYPIFLTSANKSWERELYFPKDIASVFGEWKDSLQIFEWNITPWLPGSDIFEFMGNTIEKRYLRKNY